MLQSWSKSNSRILHKEIPNEGGIHGTPCGWKMYEQVCTSIFIICIINLLMILFKDYHHN